MKLQELIQQGPVTPFPFEPFLRKAEPRLALEPQELDFRTIVPLAMDRFEAHTFDIPLDADAAGSLILTFRDGVSAALSMRDSGEAWEITQVQAVRGRVGYRLSAAMRWAECLAKRAEQWSKNPSARVKYLLMRLPGGIRSIENAKSYNAQMRYADVASALSMRVSQQLGKYIVDVNR